ncbi:MULTISPECIES: hypothetical protein [Roseofilum]|uniref:hypothetical protein n=1 Tax=Roseofilum TaxID=1233426 RepID=UPI000ACC3E4D|nr:MULTISPECIES: hypothetical protein [Roseofilum]MBP0008458.1 hypothetical protein [Roseofilum sp. Belize Diploria]MBP0033237.1 hypothetical protein [Roseofilum sp. Belize BBD 4]MDB9516373.1 hypothetical protein [Roseofilum reptotaenium CS-1145]
MLILCSLARGTSKESQQDCADRAKAVVEEKDRTIQQLRESLAQLGINPDTLS